MTPKQTERMNMAPNMSIPVAVGFVGTPANTTFRTRLGIAGICVRPQRWHTARMCAEVKLDEKQSALLIVGPGVLGRLVAKEWVRSNPRATVIGETRTEAHHEELSSLGIQPALAGSTAVAPAHVVFCAPPNGATDYADAVGAAVARAAKQGSRIVFTSSTSVYSGIADVREDTSTVGDGLDGKAADTARSETAHALIVAENSVLAYENGVVLRLGGLYTARRGAHGYYIRKGAVNGSAEGELNLVHYEDAARAVTKALQVPVDELASWPWRTCLITALKTDSRKAICIQALKHPLFKSSQLPKFADPNDPSVAQVQRTFNNEWTRRTLQWAPQWESFVEFMREDAHNYRQDA